ncbi:DUF2071 domain-containing protein [Nonomuraea sp. NPDC000554]|uniref:YqjF family protein n=1 Tax=Nonomuraea sp. NPDC000554 TaxID=3154259 RepID=UPI0033272F67
MRAPSPPRVAWPVMCLRWSAQAFLHWRYPAAAVRPLVPDSLTVETFDGTAWVSLVPFLMEGVRLPGTPALPWLSRFPEINLRTYVRDERGRDGIWLLSLDAARLPAVLAGRACYRLPFHWSRMSLRGDGARCRYRCRRRWPGPGARCDAEVEVGPRLEESERDGLPDFLTARYRLFTVVAGGLAAAEVEHPPLPLRHARLVALEQDLLQAAGLPAPDHAPLLHACPDVPVRVGRWRR